MKKIIGLSLALMMVIGMIGVATFAYFTDTETSSGNLLVAGTLDLKTSNDAVTYTDGVSQTLTAIDMSPGGTVYSSTLTLKNDGTTDGATMDIVFSYAKSDGAPNTVVKTADEVAAMMQVTILNYGGLDLLSGITDINSNLYIDVEDLKNNSNLIGLTGLDGIAASATKNLVISVQLKSGTGDEFQADGITITMTFTLKSGAVASGYFSDGEISTDNVLRVQGAPAPPVYNFVVLAGSTVTNTGNTVVTGDLGLSPGTSVVGFGGLPDGTVSGTIHAADAAAAQAQIDLTTEYNDIAGRPVTSNLTGQDLGTVATLTPGVYHFDTSAQLTGTLTLDASGDPSSVFIFQIGSTLTTASSSSVVVINAPANFCNIYWQVGSSATLGTDTVFVGNIIALDSITLNTNASVYGRALAQNGAVTLDTNTITKPAP